jgi:hypothetical protein
MEFFEGLYKGFEAEYYVAGKLFSVGYEAFKLPGDFGFDLIVTNQKEQSIGPRQEGRLLEPPFAVQVKCRSLRPSDFQTSASYTYIGVRSTLLTGHLKGPGDRRAFPSG